MIFGRKPRPASPADPEETEPEAESGASGEAAVDQPLDRWAELDASRDWRADGPYDVEEVDLDDDVERVDLGALIVTPVPGMELQILADQATGQGMAVLFTLGGSTMQVSVFAAPNSGGLAAETRDELLADARAKGGRGELVAGPFGTELRRVLPATDAKGKSGLAGVRDWYAEGPRWLLLARLSGPAGSGKDQRADETFADLFRNIVVRRGEAAMVPGNVIGLTIPGTAAQG